MYDQTAICIAQTFDEPGLGPHDTARGDAARAQRLLDGLDLPREANRVLSHERFWTPAFCRLYLDACDLHVFLAPRDGLAMARLGPHLVHLLPVSRRQRDLLVHSLAVLASALRASGLLLEAEGVYANAFALVEHAEIDEREKADLERRHAVLLLERGRDEDALAAAQYAVDIYTRLSAQTALGEGEYCLGAALLQRGVVHMVAERFDQAIEDFGLALFSLDPQRNERQRYAAVHNLAHVLTQSDDPVLLREGVRRLRQARQMPACQNDSIACHKLAWTEAVLLARLGVPETAERLLLGARDGLQRLGAYGELTQVTLELAILYRDQGRLHDLTHLVDEIVPLCRSLGADAELLAVLTTWRQAVHESAVDWRLLEESVRELSARAMRR
ncbi:MAG: hypothetical protein AAGC60_18015 [Acidobacteriota bacterium]